MIQSLTQILNMVLAIGLGGLIGAERELSHKPAGLRTHILVCMGSCLTTIVSIYYFNMDPARIAAAIMTGIGFLGAGAIIASGRTGVHGITTAATIWVTAAVGIAVGAGAYLISIVTTSLVVITLITGGFVKKD